jgi:tetratricopeptide (TPR) repeat protein
MRKATCLAITIVAALAAAADPLESARDRQDRAALERLVAGHAAAASRQPKNADAQFRFALACSYLAEVAIEQRDRKFGRQAAERGIPAAEAAIALNPAADSYRVLATLYGQAITDVFSGLKYGPKARQAIDKAVEKAPKSSSVYVARGVGNYYLPAQLGGGTQLAIADFRKAIELDPKNAEAYLWLGLGLRKENNDAAARQALTRSLELNPGRVWVKQQLDKTPSK